MKMKKLFWRVREHQVKSFLRLCSCFFFFLLGFPTLLLPLSLLLLLHCILHSFFMLSFLPSSLLLPLFSCSKPSIPFLPPSLPISPSPLHLLSLTYLLTYLFCLITSLPKSISFLSSPLSPSFLPSFSNASFIPTPSHVCLSPSPFSPFHLPR